jgi:2-hydroxychromene-2-carboxylate isomerase
MAKTVDYFFTPVSPWTYLGGARLDAMVRRHGATLRYKPCDYGKVFPVSGGLPVGQRPKQRQAYRLTELERWRDFLGIKLTIQPRHFPVASDFAARTVVAARQAGADPGRLANALLRAVWAEERDVSDRATVAAICGECGLDGAALTAAADGAAARAELDANTAEAIERQVFGAPTYIYRDKLYWGQDRLDFLDRALATG